MLKAVHLPDPRKTCLSLIACTVRANHVLSRGPTITFIFLSKLKVSAYCVGTQIGDRLHHGPSNDEDVQEFVPPSSSSQSVAQCMPIYNGKGRLNALRPGTAADTYSDGHRPAGDTNCRPTLVKCKTDMTYWHQ